VSTTDDFIQKQQLIIDQHKKKIKDLMPIIQMMKDETNKKMDQLVEMFTALSKTTNHKSKEKQVTTGRG
jgi:hypothetical protein